MQPLPSGSLPRTPLKIIVADADEGLRATAVAALTAQGHRVRSVGLGMALDDEVAGSPADLLILDINPPSAADLGAVRRLRATYPAIGIIICTARLRADDRIAGYTHGADLYLSKPVSPEELCAATDAIARRLHARGGAACSPITLNGRTLQLTGPSGAVDVSLREVDVLSAFAVAPDALIETTRLIQIAGLPDTESGKHTLEVQMVRLRKKIAQAGAPAPSIRAVRGVGYQLSTPVDVLPADPRGHTAPQRA